MHPVAATLSTLAIFILPGLAIAAYLTRRCGLTLGEQLFLVLAGSLLVSGWSGLVLAETGAFSPGAVAGAAFLGAVLLAVAGRKHLSLRPGEIRASELVTLALLSAFALAVYFPPFDYVLGGKDPGVYVNTGFHLAREGNLAYVDPLVRSIPEEARELFYRVDGDLPPWSQPRFLGFYLESPVSGRVLPQGFHLYPVWIGIASSLFEMKAGLYATPFFALLAVAGLFLAGKRLFGLEVAFWGAVLLTVFQLQVWFARFPNAEMLMQFLFVAGLLALVLMEEKRSAAAGALAGVAFGSTLLVRLDAVLFLLPVGLYLGWRRLRRRAGRPEAAFLVVFAVALLHAGLHAWLFTHPYTAEVLGRWYWRSVARSLPVLFVLALGAFFLLDRFGPELARRVGEGIASLRGRAAIAAAVFLVASYAYFIRPVWHAARTAPHDAEAFFRMSWYLHPVGVALAVGGAAALLFRAERKHLLFVLAGLTFSMFFFYKIRVWNDHFFCMRRFVPVVLPALFLCLGFFLSGIRQIGGRMARVASVVIGLVLAGIYLVDGLPLWGHDEFRGSIDFVEELGRYVGDEDVVIFPRQEGLHLLELPLSQLEGKNVLEFYTLQPSRELLQGLIREWRDDYRDVFFVTNYKISLSGLFTRWVADFWFATEKYEYTYDRPPSRAEPFHLRFTLSKAVDIEELARRLPPLTFVDVGGVSDDPLVAWFHEKELEDGVSFRWSQRVSSVFLPGLRPESREIVLRMAGPHELEAPPSAVTVFLDELELASFTLGHQWETYRVPLAPEAARLAEGRKPIVRLGSRPWRPANAISGSTDIRDLGVRVDWVEVR